jgi:transmembrane sensor
MNPGGNISDEKAMRIAYLIAGYVQQTLSPEEHDELDRWVEESDENALLFEELTDEENIEAGLNQMRQGHTSEAYRKIKEKLPFKKEKKSRTIWPYAIAASLLLAVAALYFFRPPVEDDNNGKTNTAQSNKDILPGSDRAVLTLSDGRTIILDEQGMGGLAKEGGIQLLKLDSGQLAYSGSDVTIATKFNTLSTPRGGQYLVTLSDGTRVWLNAESSLRYPVVFTDQDRVVELQGEAYFEVAHDESHPFHVKTKNQDITVLGTRFNVNAYGDEDVVRTTLLQGKIRLTTPTEAKIVQPGEQFITTTSGAIEKQKLVDVEGEIAWKEGWFHFRHAPIEEILKQVSRWYDADIIYRGKVTDHFNADMARDLPVSRLLKILEKTGKVHFDIEGKKIIVTP